MQLSVLSQTRRAYTSTYAFLLMYEAALPYVGIDKFMQQFPSQTAPRLKFSLCTSGQEVTAFAGRAATHFF